MKTMTKKAAAKKLEAIERKMEAVVNALHDLREAAGKDVEGYDVVDVSDLLSKSGSLRSLMNMRAYSLTAAPEAPREVRDVYEVIEEQNDAALSRMAGGVT